MTDTNHPSDPVPAPEPELGDPSGKFARRALLGGVAIATVGGLAGACFGSSGNNVPLSRGNPTAAAKQAAASAGASAPAAASAAASAAKTAAPSATMDHEAAAQAAVKAYPAKTKGTGLQPLEGKVVDGVREFEITVQEIDWEVAPGQTVKALSYNGQLPGPLIKVTEGERVRFKTTNKLTEATGVHLHGLKVPNAVDGVPYITQDPIKPGQTFVQEFVAKPAGSHMYHSHHNATDQVGRGLLGPLIILPKDPKQDPAYDKDEIFIINDSLGGFTFNGKGFPATAPYTAKLGQRVRFRFMNEGNMAHPIHLHGFAMQVFARDGYNLPAPYLCDTINVAPGERWDAIVLADEPGVWAFHCHILQHAEGPTGMFGMVTAFIVEK